jgi:hypothetical protein
VKDRDRQKKRKRPRIKERVVILNNSNPNKPFKWCPFFSPGGF